MDYHCNCCDFDFFFEEGYCAIGSEVCCPKCGVLIEKVV